MGSEMCIRDSLNGVRIAKESEIAMGDDLVIGDVRFRLQDEAPSANKPAPRRQEGGSTKGTYAPLEAVTAPPPIPAARRSMAAPPVPRPNPTIHSAHFDDDDEDSEERTLARGPDTLDGIRRHRSPRR